MTNRELKTVERTRAAYSKACSEYSAALRAALRPGDRITYSRGMSCSVAEVLPDPNDSRAPFLSAGYSPDIMRVKVRSIVSAQPRHYWIHVSRVAELNP